MRRCFVYAWARSRKGEHMRSIARRYPRLSRPIDVVDAAARAEAGDSVGFAGRGYAASRGSVASCYSVARTMDSCSPHIPSCAARQCAQETHWSHVDMLPVALE
ncbi:hypothetical protein Dimus_002588 [Dionaea muscipula]